MKGGRLTINFDIIGDRLKFTRWCLRLEQTRWGNCHKKKFAVEALTAWNKKGSMPVLRIDIPMGAVFRTSVLTAKNLT